MPTVKCERCNAMTNTCYTDYEFVADGVVARCYAKWDDKLGKWVKGCRWDDADDLTRYLVSSSCKESNDAIKKEIQNK